VIPNKLVDVIGICGSGPRCGNTVVPAPARRVPSGRRETTLAGPICWFHPTLKGLEIGAYV